MQNQTALDYLIKQTEEQRKIAVDSICRGLTENEYRRLVGVIQGLDFNTQLIKDLANKLENDDE